MGLESGTTISQLDDTWPLPTDSRSEGDDHLKLIKKVLKAQFPGANNQGYASAILATEDELNYSTGLTSNIQGQFQALYDLITIGFTTIVAPEGTTLIFSADVIPAAWTVQHYGTDYMLRLVDPDVQSVTSRFSGDDPFNINFSHRHELTPAANFKAEIGTQLTIVGDLFTNFEPTGADQEWEPRYITGVVARRNNL